MTIQLQSDFVDWYDGLFTTDVADKVWERKRSQHMSKSDTFAYLEAIKFKTPKHGLVRDIAPTLLETTRLELGLKPEELIVLSQSMEDLKSLTPAEKELDLQIREQQQKLFEFQTMLVVYDTDTEERHIRIPAELALEKYPTNFCSIFIPTAADVDAGFSNRLLSIGEMNFVIEYFNPNHWNSHKGEVQIAVTGRFPAKPQFITTTPIFGIDLIKDGPNWVAVDFDTAPSLAPLEGKGYVEAVEIYESVQEFLENQPKCC